MNTTNDLIVNSLKSIFGNDYIYMDISKRQPQEIAQLLPKMYSNSKCMLYAIDNPINAFVGLPSCKFIVYLTIQKYQNVICY